MAETTIKEFEFESLMKEFDLAAQDVKDSLDNLNSSIGTIDGESKLWRGKTAKNYAEAYREQNKDFEDIKERLNNFDTSLHHTYDNFVNAIKKSEKDVEDLSENLDIN